MKRGNADPLIVAAVTLIEDISQLRRRRTDVTVESNIRFLRRVCVQVQRWPDSRWRELNDDVQHLINLFVRKFKADRFKNRSDLKGPVKPEMAPKLRFRDRGIKRHIKMLILEDPRLTPEQIFNVVTMANPGVSIHTVRMVRSELLHTLKTFQKYGGILTPEWERKLKDSLGEVHSHNLI